MATAMSSAALAQAGGAQGVAAAAATVSTTSSAWQRGSSSACCRIAWAPAGLGSARLVGGNGTRVRAWRQGGAARRPCGVAIRAVSSAGCCSSSRHEEDGARPVSRQAELSLAQFAVGLVDATRRVGEVVLQFLTATPLPRQPRTSEAAALVASLKGRMVLAAAPLLFAATSVSTPLTVVASGMAKWLELYSGVLMVRVLLSWFPNIPWERQPLQAMRDMCDPYLNLFRNIIPPIFNALDVSPMLAFLVLGTLTSILNTSVQG